MQKQYLNVISYLMEFCMECCVFTEEIVHCGHLLHPYNQGKCHTTSVNSMETQGSGTQT